MYKSDDWVTNQKVLEEMCEVEDQLREHYKEKKKCEEAKAIEYIEADPANFFKYSRKFCANENGISALENNGKIYENDLDKVEILSNQYRKVWSKPDIVMNDDQIIQYFGLCEQCLKEKVHICKIDLETEVISKYRDIISKY